MIAVDDAATATTGDVTDAIFQVDGDDETANALFDAESLTGLPYAVAISSSLLPKLGNKQLKLN